MQIDSWISKGCPLDTWLSAQVSVTDFANKTTKLLLKHSKFQT